MRTGVLGVFINRRSLLPLSVGALLVFVATAEAAEFHCSAGDVPCLINAIRVSNDNGESNTIFLEAGTYTLTAVIADPNGLPLITSRLAVIGRGAQATVIERSPAAPQFRFFEVRTPSASLTLEGLTLRGGDGPNGAGFTNNGTVTLSNSMLTGNSTVGLGGGFFNNTSGTVTIVNSAVTDNMALRGGGFENNGGIVKIVDSTLANNSAASIGGGWFGNGPMVILNTTISQNAAGTGGGGMFYVPFRETDTLTIRDSAVFGNTAGSSGAGLFTGGAVTITNTTVAGNFASAGSANGLGGAIFNQGTLAITNSTVASNSTTGIVNFSGATKLQNTILALNFDFTTALDCSGDPITSLGHNLISTTTGCAITLLPSDLMGESGLTFRIDSGRPGDAYVRMRSDSRAIDAASSNDCSANDQRALARGIDGNGDGIRGCDIGAVEFYPAVNDRVQLEGLQYLFVKPSNLGFTDPRASAGAFRIAATFRNTGPDICHVAFDVPTLNGPPGTNPVLLTAARELLGSQGTAVPAAKAGAQPHLPSGGLGTYQFTIGVQQRTPINFFVDALGDATSGPCNQ